MCVAEVILTYRKKGIIVVFAKMSDNLHYSNVDKAIKPYLLPYVTILFTLNFLLNQIQRPFFLVQTRKATFILDCSIKRGIWRECMNLN